MLIAYGFDIQLTVSLNTSVLTLLDIRPERAADITSDQFSTSGDVVAGALSIDAFGNVSRIFNLPPGTHQFLRTGLVRDSGLADAVARDAIQAPIFNLPRDVLQYLMPSRFCESDILAPIALARFGHLTAGLKTVQAIVDYTHQSLRFDYASARPTRTATQALAEGVGVCRDYAHVTVALCRALNYPARYVTGYLGDIGVPADPAPMDFSAWCEVYLEGHWYTFDARHNRPRIGRVVMAQGRDATDCALLTTFGAHTLQRFQVTTLVQQMSPGQSGTAAA